MENSRVVFFQNDKGFLNYLIKGLERIGLKGTSIQKSDKYNNYLSSRELAAIKEPNIILIRCNDMKEPEEWLKKKNVFYFNKKENRQNAFHKERMIQIFQELGINKLCLTYDQAIDGLKSKDMPLTIIIKPFMHQGGEAIHMVTSVEELNAIKTAYDDKVMFEKFTPFYDEFRIIVFNNTYILIKKVLNINRGNLAHHANKVSKGGFTGFSYKFIEKITDESEYALWKEFAKAICKRFELEFVTIDVGVHKDEPYFIEVNSSVPMPGPFIDKDKNKIADLFAAEIKDMLKDLHEVPKEKPIESAAQAVTSAQNLKQI